MTENLYVYALMRRGDADGASFPAVDAPDATIEILDCGPVTAVVSAIETDEVLSTRRNMTAHARALETLMSDGPVLPMRFGLITPDRDRIRATVGAHADRLGVLLDDLDGVVEMGVKIVWDQATVMREIVDETPELGRTYRELQERDERETHYQRVELGRRVEHLMREKRAVEQDQYDTLLSVNARDRVVHEPDDELMVLKADYLLHRDSEPDLAAAVEAIEARAPGRLTISYIGPSPAYNFVSLHLDWAEPEAAPDPSDANLKIAI